MDLDLFYHTNEYMDFKTLFANTDMGLILKSTIYIIRYKIAINKNYTTLVVKKIAKSNSSTVNLKSHRRTFIAFFSLKILLHSHLKSCEILLSDFQWNFFYLGL